MPSVSDTLGQSLKRRLLSLREKGLDRIMAPVAVRRPGEIRICGEWLLNLTSNDYLGLASHPQVVSSLCRAAQRFGLGAGGSRLICGTFQPHIELERELARFKGTESALVFPSGYQANLAAIAALVDEQTALYSDAFNHASIVDGCRLTKASRRVYPHLDLTSLEEMLTEDANRFERKVVVTDSVFSTDGSVAPLRRIDELCRRHQALLAVDEAHSTFVLGPDGRGLVPSQNIQTAVQVATLSKALGCAGGVVASNQTIQKHLYHAGRSFMYTTAVPPAVAEACRTALRLAAGPYGTQLRTRLFRNVSMLSQSLAQTGWSISSHSHILALELGDPHVSKQSADWLKGKGVFVQAFRPPTVPRGRSLLRIVPSAVHTQKQISRAIEVFAELHTHLQANGSLT